jgi:hypothetical protein
MNIELVNPDNVRKDFGKCTHISDRNDWGRLLDYQDVNLAPVKVGVWG